MTAPRARGCGFRVASYDPDLPIRGRYLVFNLQLPIEGFTARDNPRAYTSPYTPLRCDLAMRNGVLTAVANEDGEFGVNVREVNHQPVALVNTPDTFLRSRACDCSNAAR
jgi:hypothetical protein